MMHNCDTIKPQKDLIIGINAYIQPKIEYLMFVILCLGNKYQSVTEYNVSFLQH